MSDVFYRMHWRDCPEFCAENAWSALWGAIRSGDGSQTRCGCEGVDQFDTRVCAECAGSGCTVTDYGEARCRSCDGEGYFWIRCERCDGTGWQDCVHGYSCWPTPQQLIDYFGSPAQGYPGDGDGPHHDQDVTPSGDGGRRRHRRVPSG